MSATAAQWRHSFFYSSLSSLMEKLVTHLLSLMKFCLTAKSTGMRRVRFLLCWLDIKGHHIWLFPHDTSGSHASEGTEWLKDFFSVNRLITYFLKKFESRFLHNFDTTKSLFLILLKLWKILIYFFIIKVWTIKDRNLLKSSLSGQMSCHSMHLVYPQQV